MKIPESKAIKQALTTTMGSELAEKFLPTGLVSEDVGAMIKTSIYLFRI